MTVPRTVEYFFSLVSPWSYIGHTEFVRVARAHGATIDHRPMSLAAVFPESGGLPLGKRHPLRQRYRIIELQRWMEKRALPMNLHPKHWPFDTARADKIVIALGVMGQDAERIIPQIFAGTFEREENMADAAVIAGLLGEAGFDADAVLDASQSKAVEDAYAANAALALKRGAIGAPVYALDGEVFWGQDRLDLLDDALTSGRAPFSPEA